MGSAGTECFRCSIAASAEASFHRLQKCFDDVVVAVVVVACDVDDGGGVTRGSAALLPPCIVDEDGIRRVKRQVHDEQGEQRFLRSSIESVCGCCSCRTPG